MAGTESFDYSPSEEWANVLSHGLGVALAVAGLIVLMIAAAPTGDAKLITGCAIFGVSMILLYGASTFYHAARAPKARRILKAVDHSAIYLLIAGTYTPFTLSILPTAWGWSLFGVIWGMAAAGVAFKLFYAGRFKLASTLLYLGMGWVAIVAAKPFIEVFPMPGMLLVLAGGLTYSFGVIFYLWDRLPFNHAVWHLFVLGGTVLHFFAILLYVVPAAPQAATVPVALP